MPIGLIRVPSWSLFSLFSLLTLPLSKHILSTGCTQGLSHGSPVLHRGPSIWEVQLLPQADPRPLGGP